jgi:hypothetical protein
MQENLRGAEAMSEKSVLDRVCSGEHATPSREVLDLECTLG